MPNRLEIYDVIVVGAGFAGLTAAQQLLSAGLKIKILEARNRVGGRVHTHYLDKDTYVDLGGQWIGPTQDRIYALAHKLRVETFRTYNQGKNIISLNKKLKYYSGLIPKIDWPSLINIQWVITRLENMAEKVNLQQPWETPNAKALDQMTLASFLQTQLPFKNARKVIEAGLETVFACTTAEISLLHALFYIRSGTSLDYLLNIDNGAQQDRFIGGAQLVADRFADGFREHILLEAPVRQIVQETDRVLVKGEDFSFPAKKLIIAIPPTLAARIDYQPGLPAIRDQWTQRIGMGAVIKCYAIYEKPFWRTQGMSGQVVSDDNYFLQTVFDNSPNDNSKGMLMGFSLANRARELLEFPAAERSAIIKDTFVRFFGPEAAKMKYYIDKSWADEVWSRGCYVGIYPPGVWTGFKSVGSKPCGHIHWAGTETATEWNGYIEGAIQSGERVAAEIVKLING